MGEAEAAVSLGLDGLRRLAETIAAGFPAEPGQNASSREALGCEEKGCLGRRAAKNEGSSR